MGTVKLSPENDPLEFVVGDDGNRVNGVPPSVALIAEVAAKSLPVRPTV
jgi:hypothetical protein